MIIAVIAAVLVIIVAVVFYMRSMGAMNALATLTGSGVVGSDGSLVITVVASGGSVKIVGIVLLNSKGVVTTIGTTPGYSGWSPYCRLTGVYINRISGSLFPPWVLQNGQSASFIFTAQSTTPNTIVTSLESFRMARGHPPSPPGSPGSSTNGDCASVSQAIIFYNTGKTAIIPIEG